MPQPSRPRAQRVCYFTARIAAKEITLDLEESYSPRDYFVWERERTSKQKTTKTLFSFFQVSFQSNLSLMLSPRGPLCLFPQNKYSRQMKKKWDWVSGIGEKWPQLQGPVLHFSLTQVLVLRMGSCPCFFPAVVIFFSPPRMVVTESDGLQLLLMETHLSAEHQRRIS